MSASAVETCAPPSSMLRLSVRDRRARGRAARSEVPRSSQGHWKAPPRRPDPIGLLEQQAATRLPDLVPIRYGRMAATPLAFYRGAAAVMAADLARTPRSGITAQLCGDAHLSNFGAFASPDRRLVFDLNDFDETLPGPWEWDVKRLGTSLEIAGREMGFDRRSRAAIVAAAGTRYREAMRLFAAMANMEVWYARLESEKLAALARSERLASRREIKQGQRLAARAQRKDSHRALAKLTHEVEGEPRFNSEPPLIVPVEELVQDVLPVGASDGWRAPSERLMAAYRATLTGDLRRLVEQYRLVHLARKVVGVGSVGTQAWVALHLGRDGQDPLFLQIKQAQASVLEPFAGRSRYRNHGHRVVEGQRLMQGASDILLGWFRGPDLSGRAYDFYVRQLWDWKGSADVASLGTDDMRLYGELCAWTLARAHARSGDRVAIAAYLGRSDSFDRALSRFAERYADQNERDHRALVEAIEGGRVRAEMDI